MQPPGRATGTSSGRIPVVVVVNVEPEVLSVDPSDPAPWAGFGQLVDLLAPWRVRIERVTGAPARFTWLVRLDRQIEIDYGDVAWCLRTYRALFDVLLGAGDALGAHMHSYRWNRQSRQWTAAYDDADALHDELSTAFEAFAREFGTPPAHHQFGDRWLSSRALDWLDELGCRFDFTVEPDLHPLLECPGVDPHGLHFDGAPRVPYRPSALDYRVPDAHRPGRLLVFPQTTGPVEGPVLGQLLRVVRALQGRGLRRGCANVDLGVGLRANRRILSGLLRDEATYRTGVVRSDVPLRAGGRQRLDANLGYLLTRPYAERLEFTTADGALALLGQG